MERHVIFLIHGIGDNNPEVEYDDLESRLATAYERSRPGRRFLDHYEPVQIYWHEQAEKAQRAVFEDAFGSAPAELHWKAALHPMRLVRTLFTFFVGDAIAYVSENDNGIRRSVWRQMARHLTPGRKFSIIGHSLGTVIAFDFLFEIFVRNRIFTPGPHDGEEGLVDRVRDAFTSFYTLGSPIGLFLLRKGDLWLDRDQDSAFTGIINPLPAGSVWMNFWDAQDAIAYPLQTLFSRRAENASRPLQDVEVSTGPLPLTAHLGYWKCDEVAERIAATLP